MDPTTTNTPSRQPNWVWRPALPPPFPQTGRLRATDLTTGQQVHGSRQQLERLLGIRLDEHNREA